jgi:hypothetical protein
MYMSMHVYFYFLFAAGHLKLNLHQNIEASLITFKNRTFPGYVQYFKYLYFKTQSQIPSPEEFPSVRRKSF